MKKDNKNIDLQKAEENNQNSIKIEKTKWIKWLRKFIL
jgi:hypothetical protein